MISKAKENVDLKVLRTVNILLKSDKQGVSSEYPVHLEADSER